MKFEEEKGGMSVWEWRERRGADSVLGGICRKTEAENSRQTHAIAKQARDFSHKLLYFIQK